MHAGALQVQVLGPLAVTRDGEPVLVRSPRERCLLARLALDAGHPVGVLELVAALWDEARAPATAAKTLQTHVLRLRDLLEPDRAGTPRLLRREPTGYVLAVDHLDVDVGRFGELAALGRRAAAEGRGRAAADLLQQALDTWRGPAYADLPERVVFVTEARRLEELRVQVLEERWSAEPESGDHARAAAELESELRQHPYRERLWELLMLALYRQGRQGDALAAYERVRRRLRDDLGVDPGPSLRRLHAQVLAQDPSLVAGSRLPAALRPPGTPFVGRRAELAALRDAWRSSSRERPVMVLVSGPPGAGATRLAAELTSDVVRDGGSIDLVTAGTQDRSTGTPDVGPADRDGGSDLLVVDGCTDGFGDPPRGQRLTLVLARPGATVPHVDVEVTLGPLDLTDVRDLLRHGSSRVDGSRGTEDPRPDLLGDLDAATHQVLARSGGWPAAVLDEVAAWRNRTLRDRVATAAGHARESAVRHRDDRSALVAGVSSLLTSETSPGGQGPDRTGPGGCPWPGLSAYDVADAGSYAGRERLVAELVGHVESGRLVLLVGDSGSGKSSLVRAGLVAALAAGALPGGGERRVTVVRPGEQPMRDVVRAVLRVPATDDGWDASLRRLLRTDSAQGARPLLVVDQLEELWTVATDEAEARGFLDLLAELVGDPDGPAVVLVVRADRVGHLASAAPALTEQADATVIVAPPSTADVSRAVAVPAQRAGLTLDVGLLDAVVEDAGGQAAVLPLLSTAMARVWERRTSDADGRVRLHLRDYVATGGLAGAVAGLAEGVHNTLDAPARATARTVLLRMASVDDAGAVSRRRVPVDELAALPHPQVGAVVDALVAARLVTVQDGTVEVAHEALFREWPRLRGWVEEDVEGRAQLRRLATAAEDWGRGDCDTSLLWHGTRLDAATEAAGRHPDEVVPVERAFLAASREHAQTTTRRAARAARRLRVLLLATVAGLVVAVVAGSVAWQSASTARAAAREAQAGRLSALATDEDQHDLALLTALEAVRTQDTPATRGALLGVLARAPDVVAQVRTADRFLDLNLSPDGRTAYLLESEATLRAVDAAAGRERWAVRLPAQPSAVAASPDGQSLLVAWDRGAVEGAAVHRATDGALLREVEGDDLGDDREIGAALWLDPDEAVLATASALLLVDPATARVTRRVPLEPPGLPSGLHRLPDGRVLVLPWPGGHTRVVDITAGTVDDLGDLGIPGEPSPDGRLLPTLVDLPDGSGHAVVVRDLATLEPLTPPRPLGGWSETHRWAAWSPDGSLLAARGPDVLRLDPDSGEVQEILDRVHEGGVMRVADLDGARVWSAGRDGVAVLRDLSGTHGLRRASAVGPGSRYGSLTHDEADGHAAAVVLTGGSGPSAVQRWTTADGSGPREDLRVPAGCGCTPTSVAAGRSGATVVAGADTGDGGTGALLVWRGSVAFADVIDLPWPVLGVGLLTDERRALVNGQAGWAVVDLAQAATLGVMDAGTMPASRFTQTVAVHPDDGTVALARGPDVVVVDGSGRLLRRATLPGGDEATALVWSDDGRVLAVGSRRGDLHGLSVRDLSAARPPQPAASGLVIALAADPENELLATVGSEGDLRLWDARAQEPLGGPVEDGGGHGWAAFTDGAVLLHQEDGRRVSWDVNLDRWRAAACSAAGRGLSADERAALGLPPGGRRTC